MKHYQESFLILLLAPCVLCFSFGLDAYIPIAPKMIEIFHTTASMVQLTLSLFLLTVGLGQLFIGPLSDQFGRRPILYLSAIFFTLGALGCAFSINIETLLIARTITAMGACGMLVLSFAIVRDLYSGDENAKLFGFLQGAIAISPTFAPIVGGYLAVYLGWQSVFYFLAIVGVIVFFVTHYYILETLESHKKIKVDKFVFKRYWNILTQRQFITYALMAGLAEGVFFGFFSISPFIIIQQLNIPTEHFGYYFAVFGLAIGLGGMMSGKMVSRLGIKKMILLGIGLLFFGGASTLGWYFSFGLSIGGFLIPMVFACMGAMFLISSSAAAALEKFDTMIGTAAAALGTLEFSIAAVIGSILLYFPVDSTISYGICLLILSILISSLFALPKK